MPKVTTSVSDPSVTALNTALDQFYTMEDIIELTGLYPMYVRREVTSSGLPRVELFGGFLYLRGPVDQWLDRRAQAKAAREEKSRARKAS